MLSSPPSTKTARSDPLKTPMSRPPIQPKLKNSPLRGRGGLLANRHNLKSPVNQNPEEGSSDQVPPPPLKPLREQRVNRCMNFPAQECQVDTRLNRTKILSINLHQDTPHPNPLRTSTNIMYNRSIPPRTCKIGKRGPHCRVGSIQSSPPLQGTIKLVQSEPGSSSFLQTSEVCVQRRVIKLHNWPRQKPLGDQIPGPLHKPGECLVANVLQIRRKRMKLHEVR